MDNEIRVGTGVRTHGEKCDFATGFVSEVVRDGGITFAHVEWCWARGHCAEEPGPEYVPWFCHLRYHCAFDLEVMSQPDHDFVPFNFYVQIKYQRPMQPLLEASECFEMFAQCIEYSEHFLSFEEIVPRSQKPGFWAKAKFVLPTGCIQEVHVAQGESALEAFQRWRKSVENALAWHRMVYQGHCPHAFSPDGRCAWYKHYANCIWRNRAQ